MINVLLINIHEFIYSGHNELYSENGCIFGFNGEEIAVFIGGGVGDYYRATFYCYIGWDVNRLFGFGRY